MATDTGKPAVRVARSKGAPEVKCDEGCPVGHGRHGEYDLRIPARFHVRETGHAVTMTVTEETRYEPGAESAGSGNKAVRMHP